MIIPLILAFIISITQHISEQFRFSRQEYRNELISLSAGISITYIFLQLLPEFDDWILNSRPMYLFILLGFGIFHITEKLIYQHAKGNHRTIELHEAHGFIIAVYYLVAGVALSSLASVDTTLALLFIIPIVLHTLAMSLTRSGQHHRTPSNPVVHWGISSMIVVGTIIGQFIPISRFVRAGFLGFVIGALFFIVIKEELPKEAKGRTNYFIVGVLLYLLFISLQWL